VKPDRIPSASNRTAVVLLAGLLLAAGRPAAGEFTLHFGGATITVEPTSKKLAKALAQQVGGVQKRFDENRRALHTVRDTGGEPVYPVQEVAGLIARTGEDLDQAIEQVGEPGLAGLRAWSAEELRRIQDELAAPSGQTASSLLGVFSPRAVGVVASLGGLPLPGPASVSAAASQQETITAERSNRLLDQVGEVVSRIFFLAERNDLEVKLWVGSTPAPQATFRFWSQGKVKGSTPTPTIIRTNGKRDHVLRGLYSYQAAWTIVDSYWPAAGKRGAVTELVEYPNPADDPANRSERLDLVNGSSFFCCRFKEQYCQHVANEKECHP